MGRRRDLLALTADGLVQLSNAGLVKRAARAVAAGRGPALAEAADGTVEARAADGTLTRLPPGRQLAEASCTCPASGLCAHRVALVVAYRAAHGAVAPPSAAHGAAAPSPAWDPGTLDPAAVEAALNGEGRAELHRLLAGGLLVELERGAVPAARLPTATVRFLVPDEAAYARCDCVAGGWCAHVALAVRAFRASGGRNAVQLGTAAGTAADAGLADAALDLVAGFVEHGAVAGPAAHGGALDRLRRAADARGATQLRLALDALEAQLAAYAARSARYDGQTVLALLAELSARAGAGDAASLGLGQPFETAMGKTRLASLGARLRAQGRDVAVSLALADTDTGATHLIERVISPNPDAPPEAWEGFLASLPSRQLAPGVQLAAAAAGQILTAAARRRADGLLVLGSAARGRTAVMGRGAVQPFPPPLAAADAGAVLRRLAERPPAVLRPRDGLGAFHVFDVAAVLGQVWSAGSQLWQAAVRLGRRDGAVAGGTLHLRRAYDPAAPAALEVLAAAFGERDGALRQVAGTVRSEGGALVCEPWSVAAGRFLVPDLERPGRQAPAPAAAPAGADAPPAEHAWALLAGAVHGGRRAAAREGGARLLAALRAGGYPATAARLGAWIDGGDAAAFSRAAVWVSVLLEDGGAADGAGDG